MAEVNDVLKRIDDKNEKIIESIVSGKYADVDFYAHEIKSIIAQYDDEKANPQGESHADIISKVLNPPQSQLVMKVSKEKKESISEKNTDSDDLVNVLVVDDNELNLEVAESILKKEGFHVMLANSARRAITYFANSLDGDIQIILTDINMPGMDGNEMAKEIRSLDHPAAKTVKIVAISSDKSDAAVKASFSAGMNGYINKPFDLSQFKRIIAGARK